VNWKAYCPSNSELRLATIVTVAEADRDTSICEEAFTITAAGDGTEEGAVYKPVELIVPQLDPEQPAPLTLQSTAVFVLPVTLVWNCCWPLTANVTLAGEIVTVTGGMIVTVAELVFVPLASEVAITFT
jgi:hypothetical protein